MLHFILLDILKENNEKTAKELTEILVKDYLYQFQAIKLPDLMTVRNKLNEYVDLGIIKTRKQGKNLYYALAPDTLNLISEETRNRRNVSHANTSRGCLSTGVFF